MLNCGIVAVGDICNNTLSLSQKENNNLLYYSFIEVSGWNPNIAVERFEKSKSYYDEFVKKNLESFPGSSCTLFSFSKSMGKNYPLFYPTCGEHPQSGNQR